ncbi:hypothetical protein [Brochothrix thermosphacta]|uniref:Cell division protein n=1 Tax=Brochothrix thermosphacta TaxID=2756 RepID=A0A2X0Q231_BROTH|nr:hypothetical protein [Brochothrix thermosphacta]ODJ50246.1 hypothetical protein BFR34_04165 [Brochothrix thermosphacta DSM 20171 = FSL F6-1036]ODJ67198.1 hypothetical protein BFR35_05385 [Brochothrix thermosphacta]ODJ67571.1 hypothetical protein BFR37_05235 [Brochothrix thermosphacta]SPN73009.1 conserved membrane protein of unknown function [Brochothrix thermosphacta]SPP29455.1 conserved membrane hypothetical protein [Brochothrix thermosphacta]
MKKFKWSKLTPILIIIIVAFIFIIPHLISRGMIIGSDAIFHFNRFYDTAMQIKTGNFQYFISMFGFQESGRIVNAFYGPLFAYLQGLLVLASGSWFYYQVLSNFILYLLSGFSMYALLRTNKVKIKISVAAAIIYMTTFAVQYWTIRQGFTSWGASILPLCLIPLRDMITKQRIHPIQLAVFMALMFQTHVFTSLILGLIYLPFVISGWLASKEKSLMVKQLAMAIGLFFILTCNIWVSYLNLYKENNILAPFVNNNMSLNTINNHSSYWLINPMILVVILLIQLIITIRYWRDFSKLNKVVISTAAFFLILSTSVIPWETLMKAHVPLIELIQFPFRFFVPCTVLLLFSFALILNSGRIHKTRLRWYVSIAVILSIIQAVLAINATVDMWHYKNPKEFNQSYYTIISKKDNDEIKRSFFAKDKALSLQYWQKSTPDYLPINDKLTGNTYKNYAELIIDKNHQVTKTVADGKLWLEWQGKESKEVALPIVKYRATELTLNGEKLVDKEIRKTGLGTPIVQQKSGKNRLSVAYHSTVLFKIALSVTIASWLAVIVYSFRRKKKLD